MFAVVDNVECRSVLDSTVNGTPAVIVSVAARCRRSCIVIRGTPVTEAVQRRLRPQRPTLVDLWKEEGRATDAESPRPEGGRPGGSSRPTTVELRAARAQPANDGHVRLVTGRQRIGSLVTREYAGSTSRPWPRL